MKNILARAALVAALFGSTAAYAGDRTVTLSVPDMASCPSCAFIVQRVISEVEGVKEVETVFADLTATVTFDDDLTSVARITQATAHYGYQAEVVKPASGS